MKKLCKKIAIVSLAISLVIVSVLFTGCDSGLSKTDTALLVFKDVQYELYNAESLYNRCEEDEFPVSVGEINLDTYNPFTTFDLPREDFLTFSQTIGVFGI